MGKAYIVEEAHGLRSDSVRELLLHVDSRAIPKHVVWVFTLTLQGQQLFEELREIDSGPLLSRCSQLNLSCQGIAPLFAKRAREIADRENLNGRPESAYLKLVNDCKSNFRAVLQAIQDGAMLPP